MRVDSSRVRTAHPTPILCSIAPKTPQTRQNSRSPVLPDRRKTTRFFTPRAKKRKMLTSIGLGTKDCGVC
ncbi:MAG: hypothetical protein HC942_30520 [Microcoleus sp. SU_5_6]|nr:hypothetical protein [Microcoleus sp. SU_5_6]